MFISGHSFFCINDVSNRWNSNRWRSKIFVIFLGDRYFKKIWAGDFFSQLFFKRRSKNFWRWHKNGDATKKTPRLETLRGFKVKKIWWENFFKEFFMNQTFDQIFMIGGFSSASLLFYLPVFCLILSDAKSHPLDAIIKIIFVTLASSVINFFLGRQTGTRL